MILLVDVSYSDDSALAAGMVIESWESNVVVERLTDKSLEIRATRDGEA